MPIQLAQCWFPWLAISNAKIQIYFSNKIHRSNFITQRRQNLVSSDSTTVEISCRPIANPKQIKLMEIEGYSQPMCSKQPRLVDCRIGVVNKLDRRRVLLTTRSTCRGEILKSRVWDKFPEGSSPIFGCTQISL